MQTKLQGGLVFIGFLMLVGGGWQWWGSRVAQPAVEFIPAVEPAVEASGAAVLVDVSGAVVKPGVYRFSQGARVVEALETAGGFAEGADANVVAREINQAAELRDGQKIYVPFEGEVREQWPVDSDPGSGSVAGSWVVEVNSASAAELEALWGIGEARSSAIVAGRPYGSLSEMAERAGIPENVMERNEGKWEVK